MRNRRGAASRAAVAEDDEEEEERGEPSGCVEEEKEGAASRVAAAVEEGKEEGRGRPRRGGRRGRAGERAAKARRCAPAVGGGEEAGTGGRGEAVAREEDGGKKQGEGETTWRLTRGSHRHADATSAKPPAKTVRWSNVNDFDSWMVEVTRFCSSMTKIGLLR